MCNFGRILSTRTARCVHAPGTSPAAIRSTPCVACSVGSNIGFAVKIPPTSAGVSSSRAITLLRSLRMKPAYLGLVASLTLSLVLGACGGGSRASSDAPANDASVDAPAVDASADAPMPAMPTITVNRTGAGAVTSAPAGIDCGASCQASFAAGTQVTLTATPGQGATFTGWTGACTGTGACVVTAAGAAVVGATFE